MLGLEQAALSSALQLRVEPSHCIIEEAWVDFQSEHKRANQFEDLKPGLVASHRPADVVGDVGQGRLDSLRRQARQGVLSARECRDQVLHYRDVGAGRLDEGLDALEASLQLVDAFLCYLAVP